ncbi:dihydrodipicolinate synthase family protein [Martelella limonii]|uniref:dihydrodipicolinate synthase family protein n=1 Tax=Martelella limonii TaxID=1647649 RepID=UPI00158123BD|nr:dihydrodipicolinate synthase family protein [Martelella limonii]
MDRNSVNWAGPMPAVTTPFTDDGAIDEKAFAQNVERMIGEGATGIVAGGCTGEFWALSNAERKRLYEISAEVMKGKGTLIVGTGAVTVDETVDLTNAAEKAGVDGALILPPYFVKLSDDEIVAHFSDVNDRIGLPVVAYNIPGNAVNALLPHIVVRLAELDRVVAVKESSGDWNNYYATYLAVHEKLRVFCGPSSVFGVPAVDLGADGTVDCFPNMWPHGGLDLYFAPKNGDREKAAEVQALGRKLTDLCTSGGRTLYPATKAAMDMMGLAGGGRPRRPLRPLEGEPLKGLETGLKALGLI